MHAGTSFSYDRNYTTNRQPIREPVFTGGGSSFQLEGGRGLEKMTAAQFLAERGGAASPKANKYSAKKVKVCGIDFDSKKEADRYLVLAEKQRRGLIRDLRLQVRIPLIGASGPLLGANNHTLVYIADFQYVDIEAGKTITEDVKGMILPVYSLKKSILRGMGIHVVEI